MANNTSATQESSTTTVVTDIIHDAQQLFSQQLKMFHAEMRDDAKKIWLGAQPLFCGLAVLMVGAVILSIALSHMLTWIWPTLHLSGAFAIVGGIITATGGGLFIWGKAQLETVNPLPEKSAQALKENLQWLTPK